MKDTREAPFWGSFAIVSYIPEPLAAFLDELRRIMPDTDGTQPHITLLPPRALKVPVETASAQVRAVLERFPPFVVELSKVCRFAETKFLYLDVAAGYSVIHDLHDALNLGDLSDPEEFEFRPHLTLGGPLAPARLDSAQLEAELGWDCAPCSPRFTIAEIVFLWLSPEDARAANAQRPWRRLWTQTLAASPVKRRAAAGVTNRTS